MAIISAVAGAALILLVLWEGFETVVLPRRVTRRFRLTRLFYRRTWFFWSGMVNLFFSERRQENLLSYYGPISLLFLLTVWAGGLVTGFALLYWANGSALNIAAGTTGFFTDFYLSGTTFFTLGLGDVVPHTRVAKALVVIEAGLGFGFLALIIGYLPLLNQAFSRREVSISLLDARAGSPPTAAEILRRHRYELGMEELQRLFHEWELWSSEFLELHLSYPVLAFFRSQHENQSWLAALTAILDASAFVMVCLDGACQRQARLTFAMARHAVVDLALVFRTPPRAPKKDRLPADEHENLCASLAEAGLKAREGEEVQRELSEVRSSYEPYLNSLSGYLRMSVPPWIIPSSQSDNWQKSAWEPGRQRFRKSVRPEKDETKHF